MPAYTVKNMRVVFPKGKVAEKNPERWATVYGEFHDAKGNTLSITSKAIDIEDALNPAFDINVEKGTLRLADGQRGAKQLQSVSQADLTAQLTALRSNKAS